MQNDATKKIKWVRSLALIAGIALLPFAVIYFAIQSQYKTTPISVGKIKINVQIATSSQEKSRGLCCRDSLPKNSGMLFVYDQPGNYQFWMKDTRIPLDIYWLDSSKKIVHIAHSVQPSSYPKSFGTAVPSKYVLETNAGFAARNHITVGNTAQFQL
jgi:hypothetical protein